mgnify:CR=1 FL=1
MGACESENKKQVHIREINYELKKIDEGGTGHPPVPLDVANTVFKSICKITITTRKGSIYGTGFFLRITDSLKCLVTNYHIIKPEIMKEDIEIEIWNKKRLKLKGDGRFLKFIKKPKDITAIEINALDNICQDILFLYYDINFTERGYSMYKDDYVLSVEHPFGEAAACASGKIIKVYGYEFEHDISTDKGSSGCPIILFTKNKNSIQVIGIHKNSDIIETNGGTFIGELINEINNDFCLKNTIRDLNRNHITNKINDQNKNMIVNKERNNFNNINSDNYITAEIDIDDKNVNKFVRIINSYEESQGNYEKVNKYKNEKEIKQCEIRINNELIPFNYHHQFHNKGKYLIKYTFKKYLTNINYMFSECSSLININLSNFNTKNVKDMSMMFNGCSSLKNLDLISFDTQNVTDMSWMFCGCSSLQKIDLTHFNTKNVKNMLSLFWGCSSLQSLDLSNFNTQNVKKMYRMFFGCSSLLNIDLSNFNTENVTDMSFLFKNCSSLKNLNLSNFKIGLCTKTEEMFDGCSLKKEDIIFKDEKILKELKEPY